MTISARTLAISVTLFLAATVGGIALLVRRGDAPKTTLLQPGIPVVVEPGDLGSLSGATAPLYWAGAFPDRNLEVTTTNSGSFVRYLPPATPRGTRAKTLTIATYAVPGAWLDAEQAAEERGATGLTLPGGRIAVWRKSRPTSVYIAQRGSSTLVEVFDPSAATARHLSMSGLVRPVAKAK
jgi:hypothetical protein